MILAFRGVLPKVAASAFVTPSAKVLGDVTSGERSSIWPNASLRGDVDAIRIGEETSIQDNCVLHIDPGVPLTVGNRVTVAHAVVLHGCTIEDEALIGIGAIVLNRAKVGQGSVI